MSTRVIPKPVPRPVQSPLGRLIDHTHCYRELRNVERERDDLRLELAMLRADNLLLTQKLEDTERALALEETPWGSR